MSTTESDERFVDQLLRQARAVLGNDPRIHFAHVRHAGARPTEPSSDNPPPPQREAVRSAWSQTITLATLLRELWQHAWLPDPPPEADARFADDGQRIRVQVTGHGASSDPAMVGAARDRLIVRGYIPDSLTDDGFTATSGNDVIVVAMTGGEISMTLATVLDNTNATLDMLNALPTRVSTTPDERAE